MNIKVLIKPNSKKGPLTQVQPDGSLVVFIREPAIEGKANDALIRVLSDYFDISKSRITILSGQTSRHKIIEINK